MTEEKTHYEKELIRKERRKKRPNTLSVLTIEAPEIMKHEKGLVSYFMLGKMDWNNGSCCKHEGYASFRAEELPGKKTENPEHQMYGIFEYNKNIANDQRRIMHNIYVGNKGLDDFVLDMAREKAHEDQTENDLCILHKYKGIFKSTPTQLCVRDSVNPENEVNWDEFRLWYLHADLTEEFKQRKPKKLT